MFNTSEKNARFSRIPENEDCENLLPSHEALSQTPPRSKLLQLIPTILLFTFAIFTSTLAFWCGRNWDSNSRPSSWVKEITSYCKGAQGLPFTSTDKIKHQSWKISQIPTLQYNSTAPSSKKIFSDNPQVSKSTPRGSR
jgi:hypothetical protein